MQHYSQSSNSTYDAEFLYFRPCLDGEKKKENPFSEKMGVLFLHQDKGESAYKNSIILAQENLTNALLHYLSNQLFRKLFCFYKI